VVQGRAAYDTWTWHALVREERFVKEFITYWAGRNPRLARQGEIQLGWLHDAKRRYQ
jgi:hypothetical protein